MSGANLSDRLSELKMKNPGNTWALIGLLCCFLLSPSMGEELNFWPAYVGQKDSPIGRADHIGSIGPIFSITDTEDTHIFSIRPLFNSFLDKETGDRSRHFIYPLVNWADRDNTRYGSATALLQYHHNDELDETFFQLFPIIFSQKTPRPEDSYLAIWPIGGVMKNRLGKDRASFVAWPLYVRTERGDETRYHFPYPFLSYLKGPRSRGFGIWPLFGKFERDNDYLHTWALWPFHYHLRDDLDKDVPYVRFAVLPFYQHESGAGLESHTFLWPFFGYTRETDPRPVYSENRYFWPFLVQGRGEEQYKNRWFPVYSHERKPGKEKHWYLWPLLRKDRITSQPGLLREKTSFLYFVFRDDKQTFNNTTARLTFLWPLFGYWNDGNGRSQLQALDPLGTFFPNNKKVKENWSPLFAVYRYDNVLGNRRHSILWDLLVWEHDASGFNSIYVGPVFEWVKGSHWDLLKGLIGSEKNEDKRKMRYFWRR